MKTIPLLATTVCLIAALPAFAGKPQQLTSSDQVPEGLQKSDWQSIHAAHEAWQHQFREVDGKWLAHNPGQRWTTTFDRRGFLARPQDANWSWGLELKSYGIGGNQIPVAGIAESTATGQKLTYRWHGGLEEWYVNDARGLEHGYTVAERPAGAREGEPLVFTLGTLGDLRPSVAPDARMVNFRDEAGAPVLNYSGLKVWDADGKVLPSRFERGAGREFRLVVEEAVAKYPLTIDPIAQQAYLKAGNNGASADEQFGRSVAVSGDTVVVGAYGEDSSTTGVNSTPNESASQSGAAYVFVRSGGVWSQQAYLKASNTGEDDIFGMSVAVSGDTVVVGASGEDSSTTGVNSTSNESALGSGAAYVFVRSGGVWSQQAYLKASNTGALDFFGRSVAASGDTVVVGAVEEDSSTTGVNSTPNEGASYSGAAYVFVRSGGVWSQQAYLKASNTGASDFFGGSVAVSGDTVVVGASGEDSSTTGVNSTPNEGASSSGAAYVFVRTGGVWSQQAYLKASNTGADDIFGLSVAVSGDTVIVGASREDSSTTGVNSTPNESAYESGAAYVFVRSGGVWSQQAYLKASNTGAGDSFGWSVAASGDTVVVGASQESSSTTGVNSTSNESALGSGAAYVFVRSGGVWSQQAYLKASNTGAFDSFGRSVAASGDTVVVGADWESSSTTGVNSTPNESAYESGAAYVFVRSGGVWSQQAYLKASNTPSGNGANDLFGRSVAVSGDTVVVGAYGEDSSATGVNSTPNEGASDSGAAYVFVRSGGVWSQQAYLKASNTGANDSFGGSVAVSGDTVVVGADAEDSSTTGVNSTPNENASSSGAAYVFMRTGGVWSQQAYLKASNTEAGDFFGGSVAVSGDTVVVGAFGEDSSTTGVNSTPDESVWGSGAAYVFMRSGGVWSQQAYLKASNTGAGDSFGGSVAASGDTVVVGADRESSSTTGVNSTPNESAYQSGAAYVFVRSGGVWSQQAYLKASNTGANDSFGGSVAASGDTVVVGADGEDSSTTGVNSTPNEGASDSGAAYVFVRSGGVWSQQAYLKASNTGANDSFGGSVAVSGDTVVVGASRESSSTTGVNSTPNENASSSGAAYVFVRSGGGWSQQAYLKASNTGASDFFGWSVAVSGDTGVVGADGEDSSTTGVNSTPNEGASFSGAAYIFSGFDSGVTLPQIGSPTSSAITESTATLGGTVTSDGGVTVSSRGVVYSVASLNPDPMIGGPGVSQVSSSGTTGTFAVAVSGLSPGTAYSFRAYAINSNGTSYTSVAGFTTPPYALTTIAPNGTISRSPDLASYPAGTVVTLTAVPDGDAVFQGWTGDLTGTTNPATVTMNGNKSVTALFLQSLAGALDTPGRIYSLGGNSDWLSDTTTTHDGIDAAKSGVIGNSQQTWFETTVTGPGNLSFWWKVSSESGYDFLEFHIDGALQTGRISGNVDWQQKTYSILAGSHTLRWRYVKDSSVLAGSDAGWVDQIVWAPSGMSFPNWPLLATLPADRRGTLDRNGPLGMQNLMAFAMGLDPLSATPANLPALVSRNSGTATFRYRRAKNIVGTTLSPMTSTGLIAWTPATILGSTVVQDGGDWEVIELQVPAPSGGRLFLQLRAE